MKVLPASMPWAALNTMVIAGPSLSTRWIAMPIATTAARIGMIHTIEKRMRFLRTTLACGRSSRFGSLAMATRVGISGIPEQAGIERLGREHGQHNHGGEE